MTAMYGARGRATAWLDYATAEGVKDDGTTVRAVIGGRRTKPNLTDLLDTAHAAGVERVYLTGARPPSGWLEVRTPAWQGSGHYRDLQAPVGRFVGTEHGGRVELRRAADWFGSGVFSPREAREAWDVLTAAYAKAFRGAPLLSSPTVTGRDAWMRTRPDGIEHLDDDTAALIRNTSPQHRTQLCTVLHETADPALERVTCPEPELPAFAYLDGRTMYAALTREIGVAPVTRLTGPAAHDFALANPYARARYLVDVRVSDDWHHIGVLLTKRADGKTWCAPNVGGATFTTWCDAHEFSLLQTTPWGHAVREAIVFSKGKPLDVWTRRLLTMRAAIRQADGDRATLDLAAGAVRQMLVRTIGTFQNSGHATLHTADTYADAVARAGDAEVERVGDLFRWTTTSALTGQARGGYHPEFTSQVWGRAHARLIHSPTADKNAPAGAMHLPPNEIVGMRGDALYLTRDPGWADDGKEGRLRLKGIVPGPVAAPRTPSAWNKLRAEAERNGS